MILNVRLKYHVLNRNVYFGYSTSKFGQKMTISIPIEKFNTNSIPNKNL